MGEYEIVRGMLLRIVRENPDTAPLAKAVLDWAGGHADWLVGERKGKPALTWQRLAKAVRRPQPRVEAMPEALAVVERLADALRFGDSDRRLLVGAVAMERCPRARGLTRLLLDHNAELSPFLADLAGLEVHGLRHCLPVRLELIKLVQRSRGGVEIDISWTLERLLDRSSSSGEELVEAVVGPKQVAKLGLEDFVGRRAEIELLVRLLGGALRSRAAGINILLHGPPGTGKTELARTLAAASGAALHAVGEADDWGDEPTRWERITALRLAQRIMADRGGTVLLFDEMEDMIGEADPSEDGWFRRRHGSKLWINRLIETNAVPVIWTSNAIGNVDPAILRRMTFVLELDYPSHAAGLQMIERIERDEQVHSPEDVRRLMASVPEATTVLRIAARAGQLTGDPQDMATTAESLVTALRFGAPLPHSHDPVDLDLFEAEEDLEALIGRLAEGRGVQDFSLLLTGPPGTGKTGLAHHLARALDRPLIVKRASDLLSKWVGETEAQIAESFREAERRGGVLLFDEVDSILYDRSTASRSWEVTQVNELLTWLDRHPLPFVAATNHAAKLDPAALRRFVFKLDLKPFGPAKAASAFERFFDLPAPAELAEVTGLTPGDFAVVRRQLRHAGDRSAPAILARLKAEAALKPASGGRMGF